MICKNNVNYLDVQSEGARLLQICTLLRYADVRRSSADHLSAE